jgi:hypothetical protein
MTQLNYTPDTKTNPVTAPRNPLSPAFERKIGLLLDKYRIPGCSISVIRKEDDKWIEGVTTYGIRDVSKNPWTADVIGIPLRHWKKR